MFLMWDFQVDDVRIGWDRIEKCSPFDQHADLRFMIAGVAMGERNALQALYRSHGGKLLAILRLITPDPLIADDLLVDVFVRIWREAPGFESSGRTPNEWLFVVLRTCCRNSGCGALQFSRSAALSERPRDDLAQLASTVCEVNA